MRVLFLLVVLVNLGVLLWYLQHEGAGTGRVAVPAGRALELVQERPSDPESLLERDALEAGADSEPLACVAIGPFASRQAMTRYEAIWRARGLPMGVRMRELKEPVGQWVYLPPMASREAAVAAVRALEAHGLSDFYIVSEPGRENAVSLGLYKNRALAEQRLRAVEAAGFEPLIETRYRRRAEYWFDLFVPPAEVAAVAGVLQDEPEAGVSLHPRDCAEPYGLAAGP